MIYCFIFVVICVSSTCTDFKFQSLNRRLSLGTKSSKDINIYENKISKCIDIHWSETNLCAITSLQKRNTSQTNNKHAIDTIERIISDLNNLKVHHLNQFV